MQECAVLCPFLSVFHTKMNKAAQEVFGVFLLFSFPSFDIGQSSSNQPNQQTIQTTHDASIITNNERSKSFKTTALRMYCFIW